MYILNLLPRFYHLKKNLDREGDTSIVLATKYYKYYYSNFFKNTDIELDK